jgi:hypothetical protein
LEYTVFQTRLVVGVQTELGEYCETEELETGDDGRLEADDGAEFGKELRTGEAWTGMSERENDHTEVGAAGGEMVSVDNDSVGLNIVVVV